MHMEGPENFTGNAEAETKEVPKNPARKEEEISESEVVELRMQNERSAELDAIIENEQSTPEDILDFLRKHAFETVGSTSPDPKHEKLTFGHFIPMIEGYIRNPSKRNSERLEDFAVGVRNKILKLIPIRRPKVAPKVKKNPPVANTKQVQKPTQQPADVPQNLDSTPQVSSGATDEGKNIAVESGVDKSQKTSAEGLVSVGDAIAKAYEERKTDSGVVDSSLNSAFKKAIDERRRRIESAQDKMKRKKVESIFKPVNPDLYSQSEIRDVLVDLLRGKNNNRFLEGDFVSRNRQTLTDLLNRKFVARGNFAREYRGFENITPADMDEIKRKGYGDIFTFSPHEAQVLDTVIRNLGLEPRKIEKKPAESKNLVPKEMVPAKKNQSPIIMNGNRSQSEPKPEKPFNIDDVPQSAILLKLQAAIHKKEFEDRENTIKRLIGKFEIRARIANHPDVRGIKNINMTRVDPKESFAFKLTDNEIELITRIMTGLDSGPVRKEIKALQEKKPEKIEKKEEPRESNETVAVAKKPIVKPKAIKSHRPWWNKLKFWQFRSNGKDEKKEMNKKGLNRSDNPDDPRYEEDEEQSDE
jgi:hypothetical protein